MIKPGTGIDVAEMVKHALAEDLGRGDVTAALIPPNNKSNAEIVSREAAILCGTEWVDKVFQQLSENIWVKWYANDCDEIAPEHPICSIEGNSRAILSGERTALNFLQTLSATATAARHYANAVAGTGTKILDTRKTLPGLRLAQKYAVRCGGCHNHRIGLFDAILIKENHITAVGGVAAAVKNARDRSPQLLLEVEVETLDQLKEAIQSGADRVLLDNFSIQQMRTAVEITRGQLELEASGNINIETVREYAETGVNYISIGAITKHIKAVDLSLRILN